jgi:hypothetical protein
MEKKKTPHEVSALMRSPASEGVQQSIIRLSKWNSILSFERQLELQRIFLDHGLNRLAIPQTLWANRFIVQRY